ncbi:MAG: hypothetical protein KAS72_10910 [Phycisphaerales bacterium]|nr:hypothetical protein [Phycisphaerales bacterium]
MTIKRAIEQLAFEKAVVVSPDDLDDLQSHAQLIEETDTVLSGFIRVFQFGDHVLIQETTGKKEIVLRHAASLDDARKFVHDRMETYERMWDGCGCKVHYFD